MTPSDCIVVGAGSAGSVLANRLSADPDRSVLLLEAGPDWRPAEAPGFLRSFNFFRVLRDGRFVWPDLEARLTPAQEAKPYFVGYGLGGGSTANGMVWTRPPLEDFDAWAALGCEGWAGEDVLPYFRRAEADELGHRDYHGEDGPIPVWRPPEDDWGPVDRALSEAARAHGHPRSPDLDFNAPESTGISAAPFNVRNGERVSTNDAYLEPVRDRENLTLYTDALVDRVRFTGPRVTGVDALMNGSRESFDADQVVLAAGAINTPAILMRSGIGPPPVLADLGVDVLVGHDSVGRLLDHPLLPISLPLVPDHRAESSEGATGSTFLRWDSGADAGRANDLYVMAQNVNRSAGEPLEEGSLLLGLTQVYSTGRVEITGDDPSETPVVSVGMLSDRRDRERLRQGVRHVTDLLDSGTFADLLAGEPALGSSVEAGRPLEALDSDDALTDAMFEHCTNYFHPVGTARMGNPDDPGTVVGPDGSVVGVEGLAVADASIMPTIVRCNTNATAVMIGERLSEVLARRT